MKYIIAIYSGEERHGYVTVPSRRTPNPVFVTTDRQRAQTFASCTKAHDRAGRYNAMNAHRKLRAVVEELEA